MYRNKHTPHERMFSFTRKSTAGKTIPTWVKPGPVYVKNHTRRSKYDPPVSSATLLHANPMYAHVRLPSGAETTVNIRDLARQPGGEDMLQTEPTQNLHPQLQPVTSESHEFGQDLVPHGVTPSPQVEEHETHPQESAASPPPSPPRRRSPRVSKLPSKLEDYVMG